jgi:hypothetical protein
MNSYATATRFAPPTARSSANPHPNYAADNHTGVVIGASEPAGGLVSGLLQGEPDVHSWTARRRSS